LNSLISNSDSPTRLGAEKNLNLLIESNMPSHFKWQELLLPTGIVAGMLVVFFPLPPMLMDVLLAINICAALIILLTTIGIKTPLEFSVFPSLLLATTLARLVLNIATTRLILSNAITQSDAAAGGIIKSFGEFVSGNNLMIGIVIFSIILIVQFVVITKGATRISEVAARFVLDGMPGKQMGIDADLAAGVISQEQAYQRREEIAEHADFFSAMDGASKFVRGDAIAGLVITAINIFGGLALGVAAGMDLTQAVSVFTRLTIGDGLVSQIPAFLIALAAALLVTRSARPTNLPLQFIRQLFAHPTAIMLAGIFIGLLAFTSMPLIPTLSIGGGCLLLAFSVQQQQEKVAAAQQAEHQAKEQAAAKPKANGQIAVDQVLSLNPLEIELGSALLLLVDPSQQGDLLAQINEIRKTVATDLGVVLPKVKIRDNVRLESNQYRIKVMSNVVASGTLPPRGMIALDTGNTTGVIAGESAATEAGQASGVWIHRGQQDQARELGYAVIPPTVVLAHHLRRVATRFADDLLCRETVSQLVDEVRKNYPALVQDLMPEPVSITLLQSVLKRLLKESVSIRQLSIILETIGDHVGIVKDPDELTELVRARLSRTLCERYRNQQGQMPVMRLSRPLEQRVRQSFRLNSSPSTSTGELDELLDVISREVQRSARAGKSQVLLVSGSIRRQLKQATINRLSSLAVISHDEVPGDFETETICTIAG
jgi:flagellar biosynthesis protein FlhA